MFRVILIIIFFCLGNINGQNVFKKLENVPESFKKRYYSAPHEYNPLHVGNRWRYYLSDFNASETSYIEKDTVIEGTRYYKKVHYSHVTNFTWQRNDSITGNSYMIDVQDIDNDGNTLEEFPLDSLEKPNYTHYTSYKYSFENRYGTTAYPGAKQVYVHDSSWVVVWEDTVIFRTVEYLDMFLIEDIADKYGLILYWNESPDRIITGAIIDGKRYGYYTSLTSSENDLPKSLMLRDNYPNPFNSSTVIEYMLSEKTFVRLKVFDITGSEISTIVNEEQPAGNHQIIFDASNLASGIYYYSLITQNKIITKRMLIIN